MKQLLNGAVASLALVREKAFLRVMFYVYTVLVLVWSVLTGAQMLVNCSIIDYNTDLVEEGGVAVRIEEAKEGYLVLEDGAKVKESEITEYVKTKTGTKPYYLGKSTATQPISMNESVGYCVKYLALVLASFVCLGFCNRLWGMKPRKVRVMLRILYIFLFLGYITGYILYLDIFSYVMGADWYMVPRLITCFSIIVGSFMGCMVSVKVPEKAK